MKLIKIFTGLILALSISCGICQAAEELQLNVNGDYLISTNHQINASSITNQDILVVEPFCTLFNEKNSLIIHPKREGKTQFILYMNDGKRIFNVNISAKYPRNKEGIKKGIFEVKAIDTTPISDDEDLNITPSSYDNSAEIKSPKNEEKDNGSFGLSTGSKIMDTNSSINNNSVPVIKQPVFDKNTEETEDAEGVK